MNDTRTLRTAVGVKLVSVLIYVAGLTLLGLGYFPSFIPAHHKA